MCQLRCWTLWFYRSQGRISQFSIPRSRSVLTHSVWLSSGTSCASLCIICYLRMVIVDQTKVPPGLIPSLLQRPAAHTVGIVKTQGKQAVTLHYNIPSPSVTTQLFSVPKMVCIYHVSLPGPMSPNTLSGREGNVAHKEGKEGDFLPASALPSSASGADGLHAWGETETQLNQAIPCKARNGLHKASQRRRKTNITHTAIALVPNNVDHTWHHTLLQLLHCVLLVPTHYFRSGRKFLRIQNMEPTVLRM